MAKKEYLDYDGLVTFKELLEQNMDTAAANLKIELDKPSKILNIEIDPERGIDGDDGKSAYELALESGYVGSLEEWLEKSQGPMGPGGFGRAEYIEPDKAISFSFNDDDKNEVLNLKAKIGNLDDLNTEDKDTIVAAINSLDLNAQRKPANPATLSNDYISLTDKNPTGTIDILYDGDGIITLTNLSNQLYARLSDKRISLEKYEITNFENAQVVISITGDTKYLNTKLYLNVALEDSFRSYIQTEYPVGAICTCYKGDTTLPATDNFGQMNFLIKEPGIWTVKIVDKDNPDKIAEEEVSILSNHITKELNIKFFEYEFRGYFPVGTHIEMNQYGNILFNTDIVSIPESFIIRKKSNANQDGLVTYKLKYDCIEYESSFNPTSNSINTYRTYFIGIENSQFIRDNYKNATVEYKVAGRYYQKTDFEKFYGLNNNEFYIGSELNYNNSSITSVRYTIVLRDNRTLTKEIEAGENLKPIAAFEENEFPVSIVSWESGSKDNINKMIAAADNKILDLADYWAVGDTRIININEILEDTSYNGIPYINEQESEIVLLENINQNNLNFIVGFKNPLNEYANLESQDILWNWLQNKLKNSIPIRDLLKLYSFSDSKNGYLYLLNSNFGLESYKNGESLEWYKTQSNRIKTVHRGEEEEQAIYWTSNYDTSLNNFISTDGEQTYNSITRAGLMPCGLI